MVTTMVMSPYRHGYLSWPPPPARPSPCRSPRSNPAPPHPLLGQRETRVCINRHVLQEIHVLKT